MTLSLPTSFNEVLGRALSAIDMSGMVDFLGKLVEIPSVTGTPEESEAQQWFERQLRQNGFTTDLWQIDLPATTSDKDFPGMEAPRTEAWGLAANWGNDGGPTLVLNGHIDVVPAGDPTQWSKPPFLPYVGNGRLYGRGACDMKAGLAANFYAVKALQSAGMKLKGTVLLQSVVGEEDGGLGTFATLRRGYRGDAAIITEPTELHIIPACAGALTFRLRIKGLSAHASVRREGISVLEKFWPIWKVLEELEARRNSPNHPLMRRYELPYPLSIGIVNAGNWPSSVPDELSAEGRLGVALGENPEEARRELEETITEVCQNDPWLRENPVKVEWFGGQFASGETPPEHSLIKLVSETHTLFFGQAPEVHGAPYGSDLRLMTGLGQIPTLHYGPGSVKQAHAPNEYVPLDELEATVKTLVATILIFCGYETI
jgi:acetylornithine deacetylase